MMNHFFVIVTGLFALGAVLIFLEHRLHNPSASKRRADWLKYSVYMPIILGLLTVAQLSRLMARVEGIRGVISISRIGNGASAPANPQN